MSSHWWNRLFAASCALAAAGVLACGVALLPIITRIGSTLDFFAGMAIMLGVVVAGGLVGCSWVCEKCEDIPEKRRERFLAAGKANRPAVWDVPPFRLPRLWRGATLRGFVSPHHGGDSLRRRANVATASRNRGGGKPLSPEIPQGSTRMDLYFWIPAMVVLGLAVFALMFACICGVRQDLIRGAMVMIWMTAAATVLLLVYLFAALVRPEWF